jgi:hypothetical protein
MKKSRSGMEKFRSGIRDEKIQIWNGKNQIQDGKSRSGMEKIQIRDKDPLPGVHKTLHEGGPVLGEAEGGKPVVPCVTRSCLPFHSSF